MTWCSNGAITCDRCGHFCRPVDSFAPFGGTGSEGLDPPEDEHVCARCWPEFKERWKRSFASGVTSGDWVKSRAETEAAAEAGLEWVGSTGFVDLRTEGDVHYRYILTSEISFYVPYLEWHAEHPRHWFNLRESHNCLRCGVDWQTGHDAGTEYCHQVVARV